MKFTATFVALTLAAISVQAHDLPSRYANQRRGNQFVTGPCTQDSDCQQGCCAFTTGKCAGPGVAQTNADGGCGFGSASPNCNVAKALGLSECVAGAVNGNIADPAVQTAAAFTANLDGLKFTPASASSNNAAAPAAPPAAAPVSAASQSSKSTVFETCTSDSDCQQGCCAFSTGKCAGPDVSQTNGNGGCGHGAKSPNCNVATLLGFSNCISGFVNDDLSDPTIQAAAAFTAQLDGLKFTPSSASSNNAAAAPPAAAPVSAASQSSKSTVFEACTSDSDCQQGCCAFLTGKCAGPDVSQTNGNGGCGHGASSPNCNVATLLGFSNCISGFVNDDLSDPTIQAAAAFTAQLDGLKFTPSRR